MARYASSPAPFEVRTPPGGPRLPLLAMADRHTTELFDVGPAREGILFVNRLSRLVFDPEHFAGDAGPMRHTIISELYEPWSATLSEQVDDLLARFGRCLIVVGCSFPTAPLAWDDTGLDRPDVGIGYDPFHRPRHLVKALEGVCREASLRPARNTPMTGSYVPERQRGPDGRVRSVSIQLRRGLYMDESTGNRGALHPTTKRLVEELLRQALRVST